MINFIIDYKNGKARSGRLQLTNGVVNTPTFMTIGTYGAVKSLTNIDLSTVVELQDDTNLTGELACAGGSCEIS